MTIRLSPREVQVMQYLAEGYTQDFASYQLGITRGTLRGYIASVHRKLDCDSTLSAVAKCVALGLVKINIVVYMDMSCNSEQSV